MVRHASRRPRGQSMVETALGSLVFITILMFGIHFAEVGYLSVKVQEAAASALWDTTSAKMHELPGNFSPRSSAISAAGGNATDRYQDFDGRSSQSGSRTPVQAYTAADGLTVKCDPSGISFAPTGSTGGVYNGAGGMTCIANAVISPSQALTRSFLDQGPGSLFAVPHYMAGVIPVCGVGRASGGNCAGGFGILLDDWGLAGSDESQECPVLDGSGCANKAYFQSAEQVFQQHGWSNKGRAEALAQAIIGTVPINSAKFFMSFKGEGSFQDSENGGDRDPNNWHTTPGAGSRTTEYSDAYSGRGTCFLGIACP